MKKGKTFPVVICLLIAVLSVLPVPSSAGTEYVPAGEPISTEAEFLAIKAEGEYYLANDITLNSTCRTLFKGVLNGNGKKLTVSAPVFATLGGTVRDLTIEGTVEATGDAGALATQITHVELYNVTSAVNVRTQKGGKAGGLFGFSRNAGSALLVGCVNKGNIVCEEKTTAVNVGGLIGQCDNLTAYDCRNYGTITARGTETIAGGILGRGVVNPGRNTVSFYRCANYGEIESGKIVGGIAGYAGCSGNLALTPFRFDYCANSADLKGALYSGGIAGYAYGTDTQQFMLYACVNSGTITGGNSSGGFVSHFFAYCNSNYSGIRYCLGAGKLTANSGTKAYLCMFGESSARGAANIGIRDNYLADDSIAWFTYALDDSNSAARVKIGVAEKINAVTMIPAEWVATGEAVMYVNRMAEKNLFYQDLANGGKPDVFPESGIVTYDFSSDDDRLVNGTEPRLPLPDYDVPVDTAGINYAPDVPETEPETTTGEEPSTDAPETSEPDGEAKKKGCGSAAFVPALICAVLAVPTLRKKNENL